MAVIGSGVIEFKLSYTLDNAIRAVQAELEKRGITVHRVFFGTHNGQEGLLRCATHPLKREVSLSGRNSK